VKGGGIVMTMRKTVGTLLLSVLALGLVACNELSDLPGSGERDGYQLLNADELRMSITRNLFREYSPFQGTLRVLTREAPVVDGRVYLSLRTLVPTPDPNRDIDWLCTGGKVFLMWGGGRTRQRDWGLFRQDGSEAGLLLIPEAVKGVDPHYRYSELWGLVWTDEAVTKKGYQDCGGRSVLYDLELKPGWNLLFRKPAPPSPEWVYGRKEAWWDVMWSQ